MPCSRSTLQHDRAQVAASQIAGPRLLAVYPVTGWWEDSNATWGRVPDEEARADLRGRLRSGTEVDFRSAFFELYCHEALRRAGWSLEHHPRLAHTSRRPDLRASRGSITAYVEVTTTSTPRLDEAAQARLNTVIDMINDRMEVDQFMLGVEALNVGNAAPATEPLCARLQAWLASLDADQLITLGSREADDGIEALEWAQGSWRLVFEGYPLQPDRRGPGGRIIGTLRPAEADVIDDVTPLRRRLTAKAKAYGELDAPFVIVCLYRFRTPRRGRELRFCWTSGMGQDGGLCPSVSFT